MLSAVVTFDVFSALVDSRTGGGRYFQELAAARSWEVSAGQVYDRWDAINKALHGQSGPWRSFPELAEQALTATYKEKAIHGDPATDCAGLLASMVDWPLWPDVTVSALTAIEYPLGLLSNIDDRLLAGTAPLRLGCFDPSLTLTSQQLRTYKPAAAFYSAAVNRIGPLMHVAASARDVRGALEADLQCIRLARPGHRLDPQGPRPPVTIDDISQIPEAVMSLAAGR